MLTGNGASDDAGRRAIGRHGLQRHRQRTRGRQADLDGLLAGGQPRRAASGIDTFAIGGSGGAAGRQRHRQRQRCRSTFPARSGAINITQDRRQSPTPASAAASVGNERLRRQRQRPPPSSADNCRPDLHRHRQQRLHGRRAHPERRRQYHRRRPAATPSCSRSAGSLSRQASMAAAGSNTLNLAAKPGAVAFNLTYAKPRARRPASPAPTANVATLVGNGSQQHAHRHQRRTRPTASPATNAGNVDGTTSLQRRRQPHRRRRQRHLRPSPPAPASPASPAAAALNKLNVAATTASENVSLEKYDTCYLARSPAAPRSSRHRPGGPERRQRQQRHRRPAPSRARSTLSLEQRQRLRWSATVLNTTLEHAGRRRATILQRHRRNNAGSARQHQLQRQPANLQGGAGDDIFAFGNAGTLSGSVNGGGGNNTLDLSAKPAPQVVFSLEQPDLGHGSTRHRRRLRQRRQHYVGNGSLTHTGDGHQRPIRLYADHRQRHTPATSMTASARRRSPASAGSLAGGSWCNDTFRPRTAPARLSGSVDGGLGNNTPRTCRHAAAADVTLTGP